MSAYQTLVVGTDGSESSLRAVDHAAAVAADNHAKLIIAMAHLPNVEKGGWARPPHPDGVIDPRAEVVLGGEGGYKMHGSAPVYAILREAGKRAKTAGAQNIEERAVVGAPAPALVNLVKGSTRTCWSSAMSDSAAASPGGCWDRSQPTSPRGPRPTC
jgi:nucleotide-binding universal stress UspA family protein